MRLWLVLAAVLLLAVPATAQLGGGLIGFREYEVEGAQRVAEPTVGIPWNTDSLFYHSGETTLRGTFGEDDEVVWEDVTPPLQFTNCDPMLVVDEDTGRIFSGGLGTAGSCLPGPAFCSTMWFSDDDGASWLPSVNMCNGPTFDHQSIGIGPKPVALGPDNGASSQNAYYCGQGGFIGCSVSIDGGLTWSVPTPALTSDCGGFHGHIRVSRITGTMFLPVGDCGAEHGMLVVTPEPLPTSTGLLFETRHVEGSTPWTAGFDPSIGLSRDNGWLYYGEADHNGVAMALSKDEGLTWEALPGRDGNPTTWVDVGAFHDPPILAGAFADVQAGDDERAAFTFMGILDGPDVDADFIRSEGIWGCDERQDEIIWHYFAAFTFDAGQTWDVLQLTENPVQVGGVYDAIRAATQFCRNLLDFNDMDIDSRGRVVIGWADGCVDACAANPSVDADGARATEMRVLRQISGPTLFSTQDVATEAPPEEEDGPDEDDEDTPALPALLVIVVLALAARRRH